MRVAALVLPVALVACGGAAAIQERVIDPTPRTPRVAARVALPPGATASAVWLAPTGEGAIALADGRIVAIDRAGVVTPLDGIDAQGISLGARVGEDAHPFRIEPRGATDALALSPSGALLVSRGHARPLPLPPFLGSPRAFVALGDRALWATADALYASSADGWISLETDAGPVRGASDLVDLGGTDRAHDAWVRTGALLHRVRLGSDGKSVAWIDPAPTVDLGAVSAIARLDEGRGAVASARGVTIVAPDAITIFGGGGDAGLPQALGGGGGWAYVGWAGQLLRTDGARWESLARGVTFAPGARIAVDDANGASALVIDRDGGVMRVVADDALYTTGLVDGGTVVDSRIALEAALPQGARVSRVDFVVDQKLVASRTAAPWGIGEGGARSGDLTSLGFGAHVVEVVAHLDGGRELTRRLRFTYASPLGRTPSYATDVLPLFEARCARCHANGGGARDLTTLARLSNQATLVRAAIREARMPPDIALDAASVAIFTAWLDGGTPP